MNRPSRLRRDQCTVYLAAHIQRRSTHRQPPTTGWTVTTGRTAAGLSVVANVGAIVDRTTPSATPGNPAHNNLFVAVAAIGHSRTVGARP